MGDAEARITPSDIEDRLAALARALASDGVRLASVFGSVLERPSARDVDLGVWFEEYGFERYLKTLETARRVLGTSRVDVVVLNRANAPLKLRALLEGKLLHAATPTAAAELVADTLEPPVSGGVIGGRETGGSRTGGRESLHPGRCPGAARAIARAVHLV